MELVKQLCIPLTYLRIKLQGKFVYDVIVPIVLGVMTTSLFLYVPDKPKIIGVDGYLGIIQSLVQFLIPFFIAALAAVSTFQRDNLDQPLSGYQATLKVWCSERQADVDEQLTRRQFLSYLFGYLSFLSIILFLIALISFVFVSEKNLPFMYEYKSFMAPVFLFVHSCVFWNLIITTLIGLFFLTEKIQK